MPPCNPTKDQPRRHMSKLTQLKKPVIIGGITLLSLTGMSALAFQQSNTSGANEVPEIYTQVADHDERIGTLETKTDETAAKVEQNTADIQVVQQRTGAAPATTTTQQPAPSPQTSPEAPQAPEPAPEPQVHPRTITAVSERLEGGMRVCDYTLYDPIQNAHLGLVLQPVEVACHQVGEVMPQL